jgi:hypothetical protein
MQSNVLILASFLVLATATAGADERWVHVGDLQFGKPWLTGKISIDLASLRKRAHHYEVWERIAIDADPTRRPPAPPPDDDPQERLTLWAIHCRHGSMAIVTEGIPGAFEPRAETLKFYVPAPNGAGAAVIETACAEVRRRAAGDVPLAKETSNAEAVALPALDRPPSTFDEEDAEEE